MNKGPISYEMINRDWVASTLNDAGDPLPHKTFENHRKAIEDMFNISIECDRTTNTYYVDPGTKLDFSKATIDMLNGALLFNRVQTNPQMHRFIRMEPNNDDSSMLFTVIDALTEGRDLLLCYRHNYDKNRDTRYGVKPIAIKQFHRRWYLIAELEDGSSYSFAFDRILSLEKGEKVLPSKLDVDRMFDDAFGIIRESSVKVEKIILKVEREQSNYFLSRPLHESQTVIGSTNEYLTFSLQVCPTYDFIMELLSHGPKIEVLAPESLRQHIIEIIKKMSNLYSK